MSSRLRSGGSAATERAWGFAPGRNWGPEPPGGRVLNFPASPVGVVELVLEVLPAAPGPPSGAPGPRRVLRGRRRLPTRPRGVGRGCSRHRRGPGRPSPPRGRPPPALAVYSGCAGHLSPLPRLRPRGWPMGARRPRDGLDFGQRGVRAVVGPRRPPGSDADVLRGWARAVGVGRLRRGVRPSGRRRRPLRLLVGAACPPRARLGRARS